MNPTAPTPRKKTKRVPLSSVALLLVGTSMVGQVLGFLRTKLVNANFLATGPQSTDAYFAAFNIPDFFFFTLAAGALGVALMPVLSDHLQKGDRKGVNDITSSLMNLLAIIMLGVGILIFAFARPLIENIVAPNLTPDQLNNAVLIMRLIAFNPLIFTISGILTSLQQSLGRFFFYAIAPLFYNAGIIVAAMIFSTQPGHDGGPWHLGLAGLGIGALVGALAQLVIIFIGTFNLRYRWRPKIFWRSSDFRLVLRQLPPRALDQGVDQLNSIVETNFARRLGEGYISFYNNAYVLSTAPTLLVGTAISTAAFPRLNQRLSQGRYDLFRSDFLQILRTMIWITAPLVVVSYFGRGYLARMIFSRNSPEIALIFGFLAGAIFFRTMYTLISRWFYAQKDTKTPMFVSFFTITLNILLAYILSKPSNYGVAGLALAQSIVAMAEVVVLMTIMLIRDHKLFNMEFWGGCARILSVTGFSVIAGFIMISLYPLGVDDQGILTLGAKMGLLALVVFTVHVTVSGLFGLSEARPIFTRLKKLVYMPVRIQ